MRKYAKKIKIGANYEAHQSDNNFIKVSYNIMLRRKYIYSFHHIQSYVGQLLHFLRSTVLMHAC